MFQLLKKSILNLSSCLSNECNNWTSILFDIPYRFYCWFVRVMSFDATLTLMLVKMTFNALLFWLCVWQSTPDSLVMLTLETPDRDQVRASNTFRLPVPEHAPTIHYHSLYFCAIVWFYWTVAGIFSTHGLCIQYRLSKPYVGIATLVKFIM